jgi:hypothetical protein
MEDRTENQGKGNNNPLLSYIVKYSFIHPDLVVWRRIACQKEALTTDQLVPQPLASYMTTVFAFTENLRGVKTVNVQLTRGSLHKIGRCLT